MTEQIPEHSFGKIRSLHRVDSGGRLPPKAHHRNRHTTPKQVATTGGAVLSTGSTVVTTATGQGALALATGAAVSATGVGLVVGGAVLTVASMATNANAARKTHNHLKGLNALLQRKEWYARQCGVTPGAVQGGGGAEHAIMERVLKYIIHQKKQKLVKKGIGVVGPLGLLTNVHRAGRAGWKTLRGTKGKKRMYAAEWLTKHLITTNCPLAQAIVTELLDEETMLWLKYQDSDVAAPIIASKMKSI